MLSKVASAFAVLAIGAQATESEAEWQRQQPLYRQAPQPYYQEAQPQISYGYGRDVVARRAAVPAPPRGYYHSRRSTITPAYTTLRHVAPVDSYYETEKPATETIKASCEFDFLGYSHSEGRLDIQQKPGDNTSLIGTFWGIHEGKHGLKVHEFGDLSHGCESTGDVWNPYGQKHGNHHTDLFERRLGDLEQVQARMDNEAEYKLRDPLVMLSGPDSIVGRAIVLYEREDDHDKIERPATKHREAIVKKGMGRRIACCVVGLAKGEDKPKPTPKAPKFKATAPNSIPEPLRKRELREPVKAAPQLPRYEPVRKIEQPVRKIEQPIYRAPQPYYGGW